MHKMDAEVSIIVPVYNVEEYIGKCIESILNQTYRNFELILINDGTKDHSLEICKKYKKDCRVRIISQPNQGLSAARNRGIHVARGKYLLFVDSDDYIAPRMLEELYNAIIIEDADIAQCGFIKVMENLELKEERYKGCITKKVIYGDDWFKEYERNYLIFTVAWNKLYRKHLFDKIRYPKGKLNEDEYVVFPLFCTARKIVVLNQGLYYYVQRESGLSANARISQLIENYFDYSYTRLGILWNRNKDLFGRYLNMHYDTLMYYEKLVKINHLDHKLVLGIKSQSLRFMGAFFRYSNANMKKKLEILLWNIKLL